MRKNRNRAMHVALIAGAAGLCFATVASADSTAARKMGQMGIINQTLQPKPTQPANNYSNTPSANTPNPSYNTAPAYNANTANAANAARAGTPAMPPPKK